MTTETLAQMIANENQFETVTTGKKVEKMTKSELFEMTPILYIVTNNPKKVGTMSYDRFQGYYNSDIETVADAFRHGLRMDDIRHDSNKGFIKLGETPSQG